MGWFLVLSDPEAFLPASGHHCPAVTLCGQQDGWPLSCSNPVRSTGWVTIVLQWQNGWPLSCRDPVRSTGWMTIVLWWPCVVNRMGDHCPAVTMCGQQDGWPLSCSDPVQSTGWVTIVLWRPCVVNRMGDHCPVVTLCGQQDGWPLSCGDPVWSTGWVTIVLWWPCAVNRMGDHFPVGTLHGRQDVKIQSLTNSGDQVCIFAQPCNSVSVCLFLGSTVWRLLPFLLQLLHTQPSGKCQNTSPNL